VQVYIYRTGAVLAESSYTYQYHTSTKDNDNKKKKKIERKNFDTDSNSYLYYPTHATLPCPTLPVWPPSLSHASTSRQFTPLPWIEQSIAEQPDQTESLNLIKQKGKIEK